MLLFVLPPLCVAGAIGHWRWEPLVFGVVFLVGGLALFKGYDI
jgi:hypothetical protein